MLKNCFNLVRNISKLNDISKIPLAYSKCNSCCWSCGRSLTKNEAKSFFCPCPLRKILPVNPVNNYFDLFNLDLNYKVDKSELTKRFRQLMRTLHPDLYTLKSTVRNTLVRFDQLKFILIFLISAKLEKEYSSSHASCLNKAYNILSSPIERGQYVLELKEVDYEKEAYEALDQSDDDRQQILSDIMELNELLDEITTKEQLIELENKLDLVMEPFEKQLEAAFEALDFKKAVKVVAKMKYYQNIDERLKDLKLKFDLNTPFN